MTINRFLSFLHKTIFETSDYRHRKQRAAKKKVKLNAEIMKARIKYYATYFCARECSLYNFIRFKAEFEVLIMNQAKQCHISQKKHYKTAETIFPQRKLFPIKSL